MRSVRKTDSLICSRLPLVCEIFVYSVSPKKCRQMPHSLWLQQCSQAKYHHVSSLLLGPFPITKSLLHHQLPFLSPGPFPITKYLLYHQVPSPLQGTFSITRYLPIITRYHLHHQVPSPPPPGTISITRYFLHYHVPSPSCASPIQACPKKRGPGKPLLPAALQLVYSRNVHCTKVMLLASPPFDES